MKRQYTTPKAKQQNNTCPNCGWQIVRQFDLEQMIGSATAMDTPGDLTVYRSTPTRSFMIEPDLLVPAGQALISAIATTLPTVIMATWFRWEWYAPLAVGSVTIAFQWFRFLNDQYKNAAIVEEATYSGDQRRGMTGQQDGKSQAIRLEVISKDDDYKAAMKLATLPASISASSFVSFCGDVLAGKSFARRDWTGEGKQFSRDQYDDLMAVMLAAGLIVGEKNKGKKLTVGGRHAIKRLIRERGIVGDTD